jgi:hypothetical protein
MMKNFNSGKESIEVTVDDYPRPHMQVMLAALHQYHPHGHDFIKGDQME